jgi:hypothetical protein
MHISSMKPLPVDKVVVRGSPVAEAYVGRLSGSAVPDLSHP